MTVAYQSMRSQLRTGDIVLFSGKGGISTGIKWGTLSKWSHVGMVLRLPEYDFVTVWESTTLSTTIDLDSKQPRKGVQLVPLSARVSGYDGDIAVRRLTGVADDDVNVDELMNLRKEISGRPYEQSKIELIKSAYDGPLGRNAEDLSSLFCSELVAEAYQRMGLLADGVPSNEYTPADFSQKRNLTLLKGSLADEVLIKDE